MNYPITEPITDYLKQKDTDYAIMIVGDWGSGKTYYVKNILQKKVKEMSFDAYVKKDRSSFVKRNVKNDDRFLKPHYISLYGLSDVKQIQSKILSSIYPFTDKTIFKTAKIVTKKAVNVDEELIEEMASLINITPQNVLIFDDLERKGENITMTEILGAINQYAEHQKLKVIIVANEEKTDDKFKEFREKTVRFTLKFEADISDVFVSLIKDFDEAYIDFLKDNKSKILEVFKVADYKNLRTLKFILEIFQKIFANTPDLEYKDKLLENLMFFTVLYSIEYKLDANKENLSTLSQLKNYFFIDLDSLYDGVQKEELIDPSYIDKTVEKYEVIRNRFEYNEYVASYILNGNLDVENLTSYLTEKNDQLKQTLNSTHYILLEKFFALEKIEKNEFQTMLKNILSAVENAVYSMYDYLEIYVRLIIIEHLGIENFKITPEITESFKNAIDSKKATHKYDRLIHTRLIFWEMDQDKGCYDKYRNLYNYIEKINDEVKIEEYKTSINNFVYFIENNNIESLQNADTLYDISIFDDLEANVIFEKLMQARANTRNEFLRALYTFFPGQKNIYDLSEKSIEFFNELQTIIESYFKKNKTIEYYNMHKISKRCIDIVNKSRQKHDNALTI